MAIACHGILAVHVFNLMHTNMYAKALWLAAGTEASRGCTGFIAAKHSMVSLVRDHDMGSKE